MEKRAIVLALALMLPLALYGVPYVYASVSTSDHVVHSTLTVSGLGNNDVNIACPAGDYAVSGGYKPHFFQIGTISGVGSDVKAFPEIVSTFPTLVGAPTSTGETPDGWKFEAGNADSTADTADVWVVCQTPITVGTSTGPAIFQRTAGTGETPDGWKRTRLQSANRETS
jgi:hypothetical protein